VASLAVCAAGAADEAVGVSWLPVDPMLQATSARANTITAIANILRFFI
jgi:hypothetical protein